MISIVARVVPFCCKGERTLRQRWRRGFIFSVQLLFFSFFLLSCASPKAVIDRSAENRIQWPGRPEEPRISYLWSIESLSEGGAYDLLSGMHDEGADPSASARFLRPYGVFLDEPTRLLVADPGAFRVTVINLETGEARHILRAGDQELQSPVGLAVFRGRIFISDSVLKKVFIFDASGRPVGFLPGEFLRPTSIAVDTGRGLLYVSDTLSHTIYVYGPDSSRIRSIGTNGAGEGELNFPTHIWVDRAGRLYVTDSMNFRIQIFSPEGVFENMFGLHGDTYSALDKPKGVATDSDGNIYVVDSIQDTVKIFDREGRLLLFFGQQGSDYGQFWLPSGIFIDQKDKIYVSDTFNGRVQVFQYLREKGSPGGLRQ